jgi:hypothetical protein
MTKRFQVGDLVISHTKTLTRAMVGRPALVIRTARSDYSFSVRLKVGSREWWDKTEDCEKVPE